MHRVQVEPVRFDLFVDTAVSEIRLDDDDAARVHGLPYCVSFSLANCHLTAHTAVTNTLERPRPARFQVFDFECAAHGLL